jgi:U3 small nucleolar RNA-associated protein 21
MAASALFTPYRAVGLVTGGEQQCMHHLGSASFLVTSVGRAFQVYDCAHLGVSLVSKRIVDEIT